MKPLAQAVESVSGVKYISPKEKETILREFSELPEFAYVTDRCLYLCLLAAAWEDL